MQTHHELVEAVLRFVAKELSVKRERLTVDTRIEHDLGCTGDDADEFMQTFSARYLVDLSNFNFSLHFHNEGINPLDLLWVLLWPLFEHPKLKKVPITIEDLIRAAKAHYWEIPQQPAVSVFSARFSRNKERDFV
jgi:hypothetical protein